MPFPPSDHQYSDEDWNTMKSAFTLASHGLGLQPTDQQLNERLARTIMTFFDRGVRNCIVLASVASSREKLTDTYDIWNTSIEAEPPRHR